MCKAFRQYVSDVLTRAREGEVEVERERDLLFAAMKISGVYENPLGWMPSPQCWCSFIVWRLTTEPMFTLDKNHNYDTASKNVLK